MDNLTKTQRSKTMSRIRSAETKPEKKLRSALHKNGYRFRKNVKKLPGTPDIVLAKYRAAIFVNGCFWHQHPNCSKAVMPKSNNYYWEKKLKHNVYRDHNNNLQLSSAGWKVITVWECEIKENCEGVFAKIAKELHKTDK